MAKEIKQKIVLEGEKQYNQALKDAQRNLRTLKSELKAETAELGKNATEQQKAEKKAESLRKQIAEQEKVVKTLKAALNEVKEKYGDNADEVARWEQRLNNARTTLANMKNDLEGVGNGFRGVNTDAAQATVATKSVADAMGSIAGVGDSVAGAIESIFTTLIDKMSEAAEALWDMITESAGRANKFTDLASYYGSSAQEIQMWSNSIEAAGGDFEKFLAIVNKLSFGGKEKKITELLGISKENYEDDIEYTLAVLDELDKRRGEMGQGWYDSAMSELFGAKKSADVSWFLSNAHGHESATGQWIYGWRDNPERFNGNESGYGMSDEGLSTLNDVAITLESIESKWTALKDKFSEGLGTAALSLLVNVEGTLDGIADYMNAKDDSEREAALQKIRENVEEFFRKLGAIIRDCIHIIKDVGLELRESDDPLTAAIGDILVKLADGLQWMVDHAEDVKNAFEIIFGAWLLAKLAAVAGKLSSIMIQIEAIKAFKGLSLASAGGETMAAAAGGGFLSRIGGFLAKIAPWAAGVYTLVKPGSTATDDLDSMFNDSTGTMTAAGWRNFYDNNEKSWLNEGGDLQKVADVFGDLGRITGDENAINAIARYREGWNGYSWDDLIAELEGLGYVRRDQEEETEDPMAGKETKNVWTDGDVVHKDRRPGKTSPEIGDGWGDVYDRILQRLEETKNQMDLKKIPEDWWRTTGSWSQNSGATGDNGVTSRDLAGLQSLPGNVESASERGVRKGISGLRVEIDGQAAGRILAPYVSREIAREMTV